MKNRLWLFQIPIILFFTAAMYVMEAGVQGELNDQFFRGKIFPVLRTVQGWFTNLKFHARGPEKPKNKIVIVEIDDYSLEAIGRWPWHRDVTAYLVEKTFQAGAKVVGLDMVFSEEDKRVPEELDRYLRSKQMGHLVAKSETDLILEQVISKYRDNLVLGWATDYFCQPAYDCEVENPSDAIFRWPLPRDASEVAKAALNSAYKNVFSKFAYSSFQTDSFSPLSTPLLTAVISIANLPIYNSAANHSGYFNAWPDADGQIRRTTLAVLVEGKPYPPLALEMARVGLKEDLELRVDADHKIKSLRFAHSGKDLAVSPVGAMEINFRGPKRTFNYVSAYDVMSDMDEVQILTGRGPASVSKSELLKDAYVLIGLSALGVYDMRAFAFDSNVPGVEGHATILDNILSGDMLVRGTGLTSPLWLFFLMTVGALVFAFFAQRLESVPALLLFAFVIGGFTLFDLKVLFENNINWHTGFFYTEIVTIFVSTLAAKYVLEERNKKFIRGAFSKYVAPTIVDSILKDPTKLSVGGEKKELTILFSDIRGFTTLSETMDAKRLSQFLNDYLSVMTDIVFECDGTLDKYIGDAVMAFWGAPLDQNKHASNACKAAIKMLQALREHQPRFKEQYGADVKIGIGINSGPVNVGNMGSERIFEYTVIGDHVNLASRLEGLTKYYGAGIVTARFTLDAIEKSGDPLPPHRTLDSVKVKGKKLAVELVQILDSPLSNDALMLFSTGRDLYASQKWDQAIETFESCNRLIQQETGHEDGPCQMYVARCKEFKLNPPNADWDGSWEMTSK